MWDIGHREIKCRDPQLVKFQVLCCRWSFILIFHHSWLRDVPEEVVETMQDLGDGEQGCEILSLELDMIVAQ